MIKTSQAISQILAQNSAKLSPESSKICLKSQKTSISNNLSKLFQHLGHFSCLIVILGEHGECCLSPKPKTEVLCFRYEVLMVNSLHTKKSKIAMCGKIEMEVPFFKYTANYLTK